MDTIWQANCEQFSQLASTQPKYMALAELIEQAIDNKQLAFEQRLPAQRALADTLQITHGTVTRAYELLEQRGYVQAKLGAGTYVTKNNSLHHQMQISDLASSVQPLMGQESIIARAMQSLAHSHTDLSELLTYKLNGLPRHQSFFREWLIQRGFACEKHEVIFTQGAQQGIYSCLSTLCEPGDVVLHEALTYPGFFKACKSLKVHTKGIPVNSEGIDLAVLESVCQTQSVKAIYITPNCQNPTNVRYSEARLQALLALSRKYHFFILEDDVNYCLPENWRLPLWQQAPDRVFYLASFSKYFSGGLRAGYLLAPILWQQQVINAVHAQCWSVSMTNFELLMRALQSKEYQYVQTKLEDEIRYRQAALKNVLAQFSFSAEFQGLNVCWQLPVNLNMHYVAAQFKSHQVEVRALDVFSSPSETCEDNGIRFTLGGPATREAFNFAMSRVETVLQELLMQSDVVI
ncbi:PLP-dependent aminotransferase family protein [Pseudoalteromonas obscura]|uniref:PLP-dependent aminotransferase family protein n=1 Tax=Pseudoalteromonas obscura TaxID=3048491 RepID=A0ABT7EL83_9GAMM|nr:PLP-dependent aminotransferase family protein [Pseudoalteromonas sp. P94(2023)]MDK2595824.1 PLP-dependent aminotransferase family protein [Pseudoalteromonas sp. P94(2023)]